MLTTSQGKNLAHELTIEYIKQNNLLQYNKQSIPENIDHIVEIENIICDCIEKDTMTLNHFKLG